MFRFTTLSLLILLLAAAVRLSSWSSARADGDWLMIDGDSYYHLRRIGLTIERAGRVPMFDPLLSYPDGQRVQLHGGYDLLISGAVVAACGTRPEERCLVTTAALSTPLLGILATLVVLLLGRAAAGKWVGLAGGLLFAVYPFSAGSGAIGHVDHHVMEPLMVALWMLVLIRGRPVIAGLIAGASFAVFPSTLLPVAATLLALLVERGLRLLRSQGGAPWTGVKFSGTTLAALIPVVLTGAFSDRWEPAATSLFHLGALGAATVAFGVVELASALVPARRLCAAMIALLVVCAVTTVAGYQHLEPLLRFGRVEGLWTGVVQQAPLGTSLLAQLILALLVTAACLVIAWNHREEESSGLRTIAIVACPLWLAGVVQIRFLPVASALVVVVLAQVVVGTGCYLRGRLASERRRARILGWATTAALALLMLVPLREYLHPSPALSRRMIPVVRLLRRLGTRPPQHAGEAVLSHWMWGHHILQLARRPTVASPFILSGFDRANIEASRVLLTRDPRRLYEAMERRKCRYLLITSWFDPVRAAREVGGLPGRARGEGSWQTKRSAAVQLLDKQVDGWARLRLVDEEIGARLYELIDDHRARKPLPR
jgi:asparagine N-glycosylation enzyme membrane subunit Stt3